MSCAACRACSAAQGLCDKWVLINHSLHASASAPSTRDAGQSMRTAIAALGCSSRVMLTFRGGACQASALGDASS
eukprot:224575-Prymnesium_polylepis.1